MILYIIKSWFLNPPHSPSLDESMEVSPQSLEQMSVAMVDLLWDSIGKPSKGPLFRVLIYIIYQLVIYWKTY
jgi:hypothetical protein